MIKYLHFYSTNSLTACTCYRKNVGFVSVIINTRERFLINCILLFLYISIIFARFIATPCLLLQVEGKVIVKQ